MIETDVTIKGDVSIFAIRGRYELSSVNHIENIFREQLYSGYRVIGFDLKDLHYIDSSGIGSLIRCKNLAQKQHIQTVFFNLSSEIYTVFELSRLTNFLDIITGDTFQSQYLP